MKKNDNRFTIHNSQFTIIRAFCIVHCALCIGLSSCKLINPADPIPAYLRIDSIPLTTDPSTQGSSNNAITDVWVFVDYQIIGVYQMPVSVPVLYSGAHNLTLEAGVIVNGIAATRINYPFYSNYVQTVNLEPGEINTIQVKPPITYVNCTFSLLENFDEGGITFMSSPNYADTLHIISDPAICLEGKCGAALLNSARPGFEFISIDSLYMPLGSLKYMELNYKSNYQFTIGMQAYLYGVPVNGGDDILTLNPSAIWQKIYVNLNLASDMEPNSTYFKVYMYSTLNLTVQSSAAIYFDNIKVIHNG